MRYRLLSTLAIFAFLLVLFSSCSKKPDGSSESSNISEVNETIATDSSETVTDNTTQDNNDSSGGTTTSGGKTQSNGRTPTAPAPGKDPNARYDIKGEVSVSIDTARATDFKGLFDNFSKVYPNIKLTFKYFQHRDTGGSNEDNAMEYLTSCAATNSMPDVVFDDAGFMPFYLSQGWVYPLDEFVKNDSDFNYIPKNLIESFTFGKRLYALPGSLHFNGVYLNLDILEELNIKKPPLDWTMQNMADYLRKTTTNKYSGTNEISDMQVLHFSGIYGSGTDSTTLGYNYKTRTFDLSGLRKAVIYTKQLKQTPGVVTSQMSSADFASKFGSNNINVVERGLVFMRLGVGTWILNTDRSKVSYNRVLWTPPQEQKGRMGMHVDYSFMTSTAKNPEAAFQVLRYITYSVEGNLARLSMYDKENKGKYTLNSPYYIPATQHPEVKKKFISLENVGEYERYCFENMQNCFRVDPEKFIPNWLDMFNGMFVPEVNKVMSGQADLDSTIANLQKSMTSYLNSKWKAFDEKLAKVQADFDKKHKK